MRTQPNGTHAQSLPRGAALADNSLSANLIIARSLAIVGIPVFPARVRQDGQRWQKAPLISGWRKKASTDLLQIERWWRQFPDAVAGIELGRSKLVVIDLDRHGGGADGVDAFQKLQANGGDLPSCPQSQTPSDGFHLFFEQPVGKPLGNGRGRLPAGVDVRGAGGWIVAPGSVRSDGKNWAPVEQAPPLAEAYNARTVPVLPGWLEAVIRSTPEREKPAVVPQRPSLPKIGSPSREVAYARQALLGIADEVQRTLPGGRNERLNAGAFRLGRMVAAGWIDKVDVADQLTHAASVSGLAADEIQATLVSGLAAGMQNPLKDLPSRRFRRSRGRRTAMIPTLKKRTGHYRFSFHMGCCRSPRSTMRCFRRRYAPGFRTSASGCNARPITWPRALCVRWGAS